MNVTSKHDLAYDNPTNLPTVRIDVSDDDTAGLYISQTKMCVPNKTFSYLKLYLIMYSLCSQLGCTFSGDVLFGGFYFVKLTSEPTHSVSIDLVVVDAITGLRSINTHLSIHKLMFSKSDWNVDQTVHVNASTLIGQARPVHICRASLNLQ